MRAAFLPLLAPLLAAGLLLPLPLLAAAEEQPPSRLTILPPSEGERLDPAVEAISRKLDRDLEYLLSSPFRVTPKGAATAGLALLATLALLEKDSSLGARLAEPGGSGSERAYDRLGNLGRHVPETALALYLAGYLLDSPSLKSDSLQGAEAVAFTALFSAVAAPLVGHAGPGQGDDPKTFRSLGKYHSLPDMETGMAFALAGALSSGRGTWTHLAVYSLAAGVAMARARHREAWPSDLFAGAALGTAVGRAIPGLASSASSVFLEPAVLPGREGPVAGISLTVRF